MVMLILLFTEILPKQYAKEYPEQAALRSSGILYLVIKMLFPLTWLFSKVRNSIFRKNVKKPNPLVTEQELESIIDVMENEGVIDENDAELFQNAMGLSEQTAYDIMTPRVDIIAVDVNMSVEEIKQVFFDQQFSRIPVYRGDKDNIIGILSEKDFFTALLKNETIDIEKLVSKPYYVSKSTKVDDLIKEMQKQKKHFAIVADEYGGTMGIVTMEDALEELVGEIYDEFDEVNDSDFVKIEENRYQLSTDMDLEELFDTLNLGEVPDTSYTSVGGFVYGMCDGLPAEGKTVHCTSVYEDYDDLDNPTVRRYDLEFIIKKVENRRIRSVELKVIPITEQPPETDK
jgi:CBS domain containing-hemolysin-like protein